MDDAPLGVGIDLESCAGLAHYPMPALRRAAERWLTAEELRWCATRPPLHAALGVMLSCKEAVYKAWPGAQATHLVQLESIVGDLGRGSARAMAEELSVEVRWCRWRDQVVTLALASEPPPPAASPPRSRPRPPRSSPSWRR